MMTKMLERILILRTIINYGPEIPAKDIADRASTECDHDLLDSLPAISRRGISQKLQAMSLEGLVTATPRRGPRPSDRVSLWSVTEAGRELAESINSEADMSESTADIYKDIADKAIAERDDLFDKLGETMARANQLELERDAARAALEGLVGLIDFVMDDQ
jgi:DNA-binding HxlR family transcriptional regulator